MTEALIVIPARMAATRLPNKPLADIKGVPMIVRVMRQAMEANIGPVVVACCGAEISDVVRAAGGIAIETDPALPSGTDRVVAAMRQFDPEGKYKKVINLQGDLPTISAEDIRTSLVPLENPDVHVASLCCEISDKSEITNPNVVKVAASQWTPHGPTKLGRAVYFSRQSIPANATKHYHHIGIYAYQRDALERFVQLPQSYLEQTEKLEQLRALEDGMRIDMALVDTIPPSIDTAEDLEKVRALVS